MRTSLWHVVRPQRWVLWRASGAPYQQPSVSSPPTLKLHSQRTFATPSSKSVPPHPNLNDVDIKWQKFWQDSSKWTSDRSAKDKYYVLPMFPYPSGALHIGHLRVYTISDVLARYRRMCGYDVIHTLGWDAFGLPAENAAIERGIDPEKWTLNNIANMKKQIVSMGGCWNWDRELMTCDPSFYKDTQKLFLQLYEAGLAYQAEAEVNYDPIDRTVLANEQVDSNGFSWRSGAKVEKRLLKQWFLKITAYREALLEDLALLESSNAWPLSVLNMQRNWLGKSNGARLRFEISLSDGSTAPNHLKDVEVFTTRPDTLFGVQYLALSLDHPLVLDAAGKSTDLQAFLSLCASDTAQSNSKAGFLLDSFTAANPLSALKGISGDSKRSIPIFVAPYVLSSYGTGAVMGVPSHDERDFSFWEKHCPNEPARQVIQPARLPEPSSSLPFTDYGVLTSDCGSFSGLSSCEGGAAIVKALSTETGSAEATTQWRLRDWLVSRQRYWGTPIPIIHCPSCGPQPVPQSDLPVVLPKISEEQFKHSQGNPLTSNSEWLNVSCPSCHGPAQRETDTMDTFVDSSWYYLRFARGALSEKRKRDYMPVDIYVGGVEHAILHLLYARFIYKFISERDGVMSPAEPFTRLLAQGMVHGPTYTDATNDRIMKPSELDLTDPAWPTSKSGGPIKVTFEKMSKSKHNGVDPMTCLARYGSDATRAHLLFAAPVEDILEWDEAKIVGIQRWFGRVWSLVHFVETEASLRAERETWQAVQETIKRVNHSYSTSYSLNTIVSDLMQLTNLLLSKRPVAYEAVSALVRMLSPIAPSFAEECWSALHSRADPSSTSSVACSNGVFKRAFESGFPQIDVSSDRGDTQGDVLKRVCAVQINGKLRFTTTLSLSSSWTSSSTTVTVDGGSIGIGDGGNNVGNNESSNNNGDNGSADGEGVPSTSLSTQTLDVSRVKNRVEEADIIRQILDAPEAKGILSNSPESSNCSAKWYAAHAKRVIIVKGCKTVNFVF